MCLCDRGEPMVLVVPMTAGIAGACAMSGEPIRVKNAYDHPKFVSTFDLRSGFKTKQVAHSCSALHSTTYDGTVLLYNSL